jgi:hypothetical protein
MIDLSRVDDAALEQDRTARVVENREQKRVADMEEPRLFGRPHRGSRRHGDRGADGRPVMPLKFARLR